MESADLINSVIVISIMLLLSAFFSGMEIAFVSVDKLRFEMDRKPGPTATVLEYFFRNPNNFISTMLVGNNIALVVYGIFMAEIIQDKLLFYSMKKTSQLKSYQKLFNIILT